MGIAGVDTGCAEDGGRVIAAAAENRCSGLQAEQRGCFRQKRGNQLLRANDTFWQQPPRDSAEGDLRIIPTAMMRIVKTCCPSAGVLVKKNEIGTRVGDRNAAHLRRQCLRGFHQLASGLLHTDP